MNDARQHDRRQPDSHRYIVYGTTVESEIPLTSVAECRQPNAPVSTRIVLGTDDYFRARSRDIAMDPDEWIQHVALPDGGLYLRAEGVFETVVSADGRHAVCARLGDTDDRSFEANLLNFVLGASLMLGGEEPLHATVVQLGSRAVGLLGESGAGKSTLAAYLIGQGAELVTDDMLRVTFAGDQTFAHPGPCRLKLFDEAARRFLADAVGAGSFNSVSGKIMVRPHAAAAPSHRQVPLAGLFLLEEPLPGAPADAVSMRRLAGVELARTLIASTMNSRYHTPARLSNQFRFADRLARALPVFAVAYPRHFAVMDRVGEEIRRALEP
jgi:hypothetical protein